MKGMIDTSTVAIAVAATVLELNMISTDDIRAYIAEETGISVWICAVAGQETTYQFVPVSAETDEAIVNAFGSLMTTLRSTISRNRRGASLC